MPENNGSGSEKEAGKSNVTKLFPDGNGDEAEGVKVSEDEHKKSSDQKQEQDRNKEPKFVHGLAILATEDFSAFRLVNEVIIDDIEYKSTGAIAPIVITTMAEKMKMQHRIDNITEQVTIALFSRPLPVQDKNTNKTMQLTFPMLIAEMVTQKLVAMQVEQQRTMAAMKAMEKGIIHPV
jgi:hypothetical protein